MTKYADRKLFTNQISKWYIKVAIRFGTFLIGSNNPSKWQKELVGKQLLTFSFIL